MRQRVGCGRYRTRKFDAAPNLAKRAVIQKVLGELGDRLPGYVYIVEGESSYSRHPACGRAKLRTKLRLFSPQDITFQPSPSPLQNSKPKLPGNLGEVLIQIDWRRRELRLVRCTRDHVQTTPKSCC